MLCCCYHPQISRQLCLFSIKSENNISGTVKIGIGQEYFQKLSEICQNCQRSKLALNAKLNVKPIKPLLKSIGQRKAVIGQGNERNPSVSVEKRPFVNYREQNHLMGLNQA